MRQLILALTLFLLAAAASGVIVPSCSVETVDGACAATIEDEWLLCSVSPTAETGQRLVAAICFAYGYQEDIDDGAGGTIPNPVTCADWADQRVADLMTAILVSAETRQAQDSVEPVIPPDPPIGVGDPAP